MFMGTPDFSVGALQALIDGPDEVVGVFTQPDKPAGRGKKMQPTPVKVLAEQHNIPVFQPKKLRNAEPVQKLRDLKPDLAVVVAYGQILSQEVLDIPTHGCLNIHASVLPRWRGAAPIQRAIQAGDAITGVTIMQMDAGLDTGPMLLVETVPIEANTTGGVLHDQLAELGSRLIVEAVAALQQDAIHPQPQPDHGETYAHKLKREESHIDWALPAVEIERMLRAFDPWPASVTGLDEKPLKLFRARLAQGSGEPGVVTAIHDDGFEVACGEGSLVVTEIQAPGKKRMAAADWLRGHGLQPGIRLHTP
ncbi:putative methionyl-tRNA formyltransferase [Magnetofaba australis IT-1]|uniref:Methionyl-tRNA formyltransferase n=1 Tax=Magnetofaba australis IT-1 TaxID=1434232 RepID=A0A1Y2K7C2_9PROT|nr:putative methionyl-tRNA formyltransferase [Magnetofaba australis IT-1]